MINLFAAAVQVSLRSASFLSFGSCVGAGLRQSHTPFAQTPCATTATVSRVPPVPLDKFKTMHDRKVCQADAGALPEAVGTSPPGFKHNVCSVGIITNRRCTDRPTSQLWVTSFCQLHHLLEDHLALRVVAPTWGMRGMGMGDEWGG